MWSFLLQWQNLGLENPLWTRINESKIWSSCQMLVQNVCTQLPSEEQHRCTAQRVVPWAPVLSFLVLQLRYSAQSLFDYMKNIQNDSSAMEGFCETLLKVFEDNLRNDR